MRHVDVSGKTQLDDTCTRKQSGLTGAVGYELRSHHVVFQHEAGLVFVSALDQAWFQDVELLRWQPMESTL